MSFESGTVVLGITGSIAAYKAADVTSRLKDAGFNVHVLMTENATRFIAPLTFETLSGNPVVYDMFNRDRPWEVEHISLAKCADVFLIAPATANVIGKIAAGIADDMLTTTFMAATCSKLIAPAMNTNMLMNSIVQDNLRRLLKAGVKFIEPGRGRLACGDEGYGKLAPVDDIVSGVLEALKANKDYAGKKVLVTAGPTREAIDPVRYISNRSSGKMGYAIAEEAKARGADVTLISGPAALPDISGVNIVRINTADEMLKAAYNHFKDCDVLIKAAAPADYRPAEASPVKLKKTDDDIVFTFVKTPDILTELSRNKTGQLIVGFAAETNDVESYAKKKLMDKKLDMIVANGVMKSGAGFDVDTNNVTIYFMDGRSKNAEGTKRHVAKIVLDSVLELM